MDIVIRPLYAALLVHFLLLHSSTCMGGDVKINSSCAPSSCGNISNISSPFRLIDDPENCGDHSYNLSCENNLTVLYLSSRRYKYYVQEIDYTRYTIRLVDAGIQKDNCSSIPRYSLGDNDFWDSYGSGYYRLKGSDLWKAEYVSLAKPITYVKCANRVSHPLYVDVASCNNNATNTSSSTLALYSYVYIGWLTALELRPSCQIEHMSFIASKGLIQGDENLSYEDVHNQLVYGFELSWLPARETPDRPICFLDRSNEVRCIPYWFLNLIRSGVFFGRRLYLELPSFYFRADDHLSIIQRNILTTIFFFVSSATYS